MPKPKRPASDRLREHRIEEEIVVDAYGPDERALSWYYYLEGKLRFPFKAKCIAKRGISPLEKGEEVAVLGMAPEDDCTKEMFVIVGFAGRKFGVPLAQLDPVGTDYLVSPSHPDDRSEATFFMRFGFNAQDWEVLADALRAIALRNPVAVVEDSAHGTRYTVEGPLQTPDGRSPLVRTVWIVEPGSAPRLVTAHPL